MASLIGFMLLKLITIFSTGLLILSPTHIIRHDVRLETESTISTASYCSYSNFVKGSGCELSLPSINSLLNYDGIVTNSVPYPQGTNSKSMFETIRIPAETPPGAFISAIVQGFYRKLQCEVATVHNNSGLPSKSEFVNPGRFAENSDGFINGNAFEVSLGPKKWVVSEEDLGAMYTFCNPTIEVCPSRVVNTYDFGTQMSIIPPWMLMVTDLRYNQTISPTLNQSALPEAAQFVSSVPVVNVTEWSVHMAATSAILCNISYSLEDTKLRISTAKDDQPHSLQASGPLSHTTHHLEEYTVDDMGLDYHELMSGVYAADFPTSMEASAEDMFDLLNLFDLMSQSPGYNDPSDYLDPATLIDRASSAYEILMAQMASEDLRIKEERNLTGTMEYFENRLHVKALSFWMMSAGFVGMIGLAMIVFLTRPDVALPCDPEPLGPLSFILASSQATTDEEHTGSLDHISAALSQGSHVSAAHDPGSGGLLEDWQPFAASKFFKIAALLVSSSVLVLLAVLQHVSDHSNGIADVSSDSVGHSLSTYIPAASMLLLNTLCTSLAFAVTLMYPYHELKRGAAKADRTSLLDICGKPPVVVAYKSLKHLIVAPACISMALILSTFLTIVVSGLYTTAAVPLLRPVTAHQMDYFNFTWDSSATDNGAMTVLNLMEYSNASSPPFTFDELAIPMVEFAKDQSQALDSLPYNKSFSLGVTLPVLRASLNCTVISKEDFSVVEVPFYNDTGSGCMEMVCGHGMQGAVPESRFEVNARPASYCNLPGKMNNISSVNYVRELVYPTNDYEGGVNSLSGCPSLAFTLGYFSSNQSLAYKHQDTTNKNNVTTFVCSQYIEEAPADVHSLLPSLAIDYSRPPTFDADNSRVVSLTQWDIVAEISQLSNFPLYHFVAPTPYSNVTNRLDTFMQIALSGKSAIPAQELIHPTEADRFIESVQHIYRLYMAQAINANMRQNFSAPAGHKRDLDDIGERNGPIALNATLLDLTRMRIVQNRVSAIVLEVLIGIIRALCVVANTTSRLSGLLVHNPCSIAGAISLLDGSRFCKILGDNVIHSAHYDKMERQKLLRTWRYSLGWWDVKGVPVQRNKCKKAGARFGIDIDPPESGQKESQSA